jgi:hypothetical protein
VGEQTSHIELAKADKPYLQEAKCVRAAITCTPRLFIGNEKTKAMYWYNGMCDSSRLCT